MKKLQTLSIMAAGLLTGSSWIYAADPAAPTTEPGMDAAATTPATTSVEVKPSSPTTGQHVRKQRTMKKKTRTTTQTESMNTSGAMGSGGAAAGTDAGAMGGATTETGAPSRDTSVNR